MNPPRGPVADLTTAVVLLALLASYGLGLTRGRQLERQDTDSLAEAAHQTNELAADALFETRATLELFRGEPRVRDSTCCFAPTEVDR